MSDAEEYDDLHDFVEGDDEDDGIDNEDTLAEDEMLGDEDNDLDALHEEADMDIEELRRRYCAEPEVPESSAPPADPLLTVQASGNVEGSSAVGAGTDADTEEAGAPLEGQPGVPFDSSGSTYDSGQAEDEESELRRFMQAGSDNLAGYGSDDDGDYLPEGTPRIGPEYQHMNIPEVDPDYVPVHDADLLWKPTTTLNNAEIDEYLESVAACSIDFMQNKEPAGEGVPIRRIKSKRAPPPPRPRDPNEPAFWDSEEGLYLLMQHSYDREAAKEDFKQGPPDVNLPRKSHFGIYPTWTAAEIRSFELGMVVYMKNFHRLRHEYLPAKSVGEIVHFYYRWKKSERHDKWKYDHFPEHHGPAVAITPYVEHSINNPNIPPEEAARVIAEAEAARIGALNYWEQQKDGGYEGGEEDDDEVVQN